MNKDVEELGAKVLHQWATLGDYDFVNIVEAPDAATIARVWLVGTLAQDGDAPGASGLEELVGIDLVRPAEEVLLRFFVGRAVDCAPASRVR